MEKLKTVVKVYLAEIESSYIENSERFDYKNGAYTVTETIKHVKKGRFFALLSCGHIRQGTQHENFSKSKRLECFCHEGYFLDDESKKICFERNRELVLDHTKKGLI